MAGTMTEKVIRSRAASSRKCTALKARMAIIVPAARTIVCTQATSPVTWFIGTVTMVLSCGPRPMTVTKLLAEWMMPRPVSVAPLGTPVVPEV